jgi:hypothetical protein
MEYLALIAEIETLKEELAALQAKDKVQAREGSLSSCDG